MYNLIKGFNNFIGCVPFAAKGIETKNVGGLAVITQKSDLSCLRVLYGDAEGKILTGSYVCVKGSEFKSNWANQIYTANGISFILVPLGAVLLVSPEEVK